MENLDLRGKHYIITGGSKGIGFATAIAIAHTGANVVITVRNLSTARDLVNMIRTVSGNDNVSAQQLELLDEGSIEKFAARWSQPLDGLICNAGVMGQPFKMLTSTGIEFAFATNHLAHFKLANGLHGALAKAKGRVVVVSSAAHYYSPVRMDDINFYRRHYRPMSAYGQSKTANILFAVEAAKRWKADGISVNALMPGDIPTSLQKYYADWINGIPSDQIKSPEQGAATSTMLAVSPIVEGVTGKYFVNCNEAKVSETRRSDKMGVAPYALDPKLASALWELSLQMDIGRLQPFRTAG